ncbi:MAG: hypothetical protein NT159_11700 [Proteobacteria bacterium]|nr:hypothetical protein [Pseudomonadota bacterium]
MDKHDLELLTEFCAEQRSNFNPNSWEHGSRIDSRPLAVTAHYLSMTSWYGHELELELIAESLLPGISDKRRFNSELKELAMDIPYLSATIRYRTEMRRVAEGTSPKFWPYVRASRSTQTTTGQSSLD